MDLKKTGYYIQMKRKDLGLTQAELAEKLGMSNKSVSKWERGVCLPDVSIYMELCEILGISLNEFIAGEDIEAGEIVKKSEENIVEIIKNELMKRNKLKWFTMGLLIVSILLATFTGYNIYKTFFLETNYLEKLDNMSEEAILANTLYLPESVYLYRYNIDNSFERITVKSYEYQKDVLIKEDILADEVAFENETLDEGDGILAIIYGGCNSDSRIIASRNGFNQCHETTFFGALGEELGSANHGRLEGKITKIKKGKEYGLFVAFSNVDGGDLAYTIESMEKKEVELKENDYTVYVTVTFS